MECVNVTKRTPLFVARTLILIEKYETATRKPMVALGGDGRRMDSK